MAILYSSSAATGGGAGTYASPYTLAELWANVAAGDEGRMLNDGVYVQTATITASKAGTGANPITITGWKADNSGIDTARWTKTGAVNDLLYCDSNTYRSYILKYIEFYGANRYGLYLYPGANWSLRHCIIRNCGDYGLRLQNQFRVHLHDCAIYSNSGGGILSYLAVQLGVHGCTVRDNTGNAVWVYFGTANSFVDTVIARSAYGVYASVAGEITVSHCVIDACTTAGIYQIQDRFTIVSSSQITNCGTGIKADDGAVHAYDCNFWGNTANTLGNVRLDGNTAANPFYANAAAGDWTTQAEEDAIPGRQTLLGAAIPDTHIKAGITQGAAGGAYPIFGGLIV